MFENLTLESEERRTSPTEQKVDASPEVTAIVKQAWAKQQESGETSLGHKVGPLGDKDVVDNFHAQARSACAEHEPRLKYRKLTRVGKSKDPANAYFTVTQWPSPEDETAEETAEREADSEDAKTPARRGRTAK